MNYNTLYNHNTTQGIAEITTKDATGSAGPDTGEAVGKANTRMLLQSKTIRSISLSHAQEHDSFKNSEQISKEVEDQRYYISDKVQNIPKKTINSSQDLKKGSDIESKALPKSFKGTTALNQAQSHLYKQESSNIYGGVGGEGQLDTVRSWALHNNSNCKSATIMQSQRDPVLHPDMTGNGENQGKLKNVRESESSRKEVKNPSSSKDAGTRGHWHFQASAESLLQIRASHLVKLMFMMILVLATFSIVFHSRIRALEEEKTALLNELGTVKMNVELLVSTMEDIRQAIPPRSQQHHASNEEEDDVRLPNGFAGRDKGKGIEKKRIVKRAAVAGRSTKGLAYRPDTVTYNSLNNGTTGSSYLDEWTVDESRHSKDPRAVYLELDSSSINIKKPRQLIGPWYLPKTGNTIGFNDMWYNGLALDSNGTSVVFGENGLFLISAQVFYQIQHMHDSKPIPTGYRIHLKKNGSVKRPLTIAECVPSFPSTIYQTCFTQVAWYVEVLDEVYLEHFTDSRPTIEALRSGQTFLGLVRLH